MSKEKTHTSQNGNSKYCKVNVDIVSLVYSTLSFYCTLQYINIHDEFFFNPLSIIIVSKAYNFCLFLMQWLHLYFWA